VKDTSRTIFISSISHLPRNVQISSHEVSKFTAQLTSLRLLDLGRNQFLTLLVDILAHLHHLELLDISGNPITNLPPNVGSRLTCTIKR
jgi:Leucine-rich repeat (LRR) protein